MRSIPWPCCFCSCSSLLLCISEKRIFHSCFFSNMKCVIKEDGSSHNEKRLRPGIEKDGL